MRRAPVPERDWTMAILSSLTLGEEAPKTRLDTNLPYSGNPVIGAYSIVNIHGSRGMRTFIEMFCKDPFFCLEDAIQDIRFPFIISVRPNTQTNFLQSVNHPLSLDTLESLSALKSSVNPASQFFRGEFGEYRELDPGEPLGHL